ncbi:MAG: hypothetical protein AAF447_28635, partial [Myxococcota bacterium]
MRVRAKILRGVPAGLLAGAVALGFALLFPPPPAAAQGWGLTRDRGSMRSSMRARGMRAGATMRRRPASAMRTPPPREAPGDRTEELLVRYRRILDADPRETFAFQRLLELYRERDGGLDALVADLEAERAGDQTA